VQTQWSSHDAYQGRDVAKTILVADDDRTVRAVLTRILEAEGFKVLQAERGEKCLFLSMEKPIDGFLIDLNMPGLDGVEVCRRIRSLERHKLTPIICVTGNSDDNSVSRAFAAGADDFIAKPVNPTTLHARLSGHLQKMDYMKEMERVRKNLNRYISRRTQTMVEAYSITGILPLPEPQDVCVMFSDVRGFTQLSQELEPTILFDVLSNHLGMQVDSVYRHGGYIDKFAGDGIMAVFDSDRRVAESCRCALEIMEATQSRAMSDDGRVLELGIGIHCGTALVGNIGSDNHLDYSVIGETVNLAARLCGFAEPLSIVVSESVVDSARMESDFFFTAPCEVKVRGFRDAVIVYNVARSREK
jgi:adenylate cyclase